MKRMQQHVNIKSPVWGEIFKLPSIPLDFNVGFAQTVPGIVKIAHTLIGMICLAVIAHFCQMHNPMTGRSLGLLCSGDAAYLLLVSYGCFVTSLIMLAASLLSYFTASFLPKTAFEFGYHLMSTILYLSSSINLLVTLLVNNAQDGSFPEPNFEAKVSASDILRTTGGPQAVPRTTVVSWEMEATSNCPEQVLGMINGILYGASTYFSFKAQKEMS